MQLLKIFQYKYLIFLYIKNISVFVDLLGVGTVIAVCRGEIPNWSIQTDTLQLQRYPAQTWPATGVPCNTQSDGQT